MFFRIHAGLVWAAILAMAVAAPASAQPCQEGEAAAATAPFKCVKIDLQQLTFDKVLPFDEAFLMQGDASNATRVDVSYRETDDTVLKLQRRLRKMRRKIIDASLKKVKRERAKRDTEKIDQVIARQKSRADDLEAEIRALERNLKEQPGIPLASWEKDSSTVFTVRIPALEPESYYTFEFLLIGPVSPDELAVFKTRAKLLVDEVLWDVRIENDEGEFEVDFTAEQSEQLRKDLVDAMKEALEDKQLIAPMTLFDTALSHDAVRTEFNLLAVEVADRQGNRDGAIANYQRGHPAFKDKLGTLRTSNAIIKLKNALAAQADEDENLRDLLVAYKDALGLLELGPDDLGLVAQGYNPRDSNRPNIISRDTTEIAFFIANYDATYERLNSLHMLIRKLVDTDSEYQEYLQTMQQAGRLSMDDTNALKTLAANQPGALLRGLVGDAFRLRERVATIKRMLEQRAEEILVMVEAVELRAEEGRVVIESTTIGNVATPQANYISADAGLMYAGEAGTTLFLGTNIYLRPINKSVPLSQRGSFKHRFAFNFGLTVQGIADSGQTRKDLFGSQSLLLGGGFRITESLRIGFGGLIFNRQDPNFFVDDFEPGVVPYVSVSFDVDVAKTFKGFGGLFNLP